MGIKAILTMPSHHFSTASNLVCPSSSLPILYEFLKTTLFFKHPWYISLNHASLNISCVPTYIILSFFYFFLSYNSKFLILIKNEVNPKVTVIQCVLCHWVFPHVLCWLTKDFPTVMDLSILHPFTSNY